MSTGSTLTIEGMQISLAPGWKVVRRAGAIHVYIEAGLRGSPNRRRGTGAGKRSPDPTYSPLEVWLWQHRDRLFDEAWKDTGASWRQVAIRAGAPDHGVLSDVVSYTMSHAARVDGRAYPYRGR